MKEPLVIMLPGVPVAPPARFMLDRDHHPVAWARAWDALVAFFGPAGACTAPGCRYCHLCPDCGETWQYMGTSRDGGHEFRHRHHPTHQNRVYVMVPAIAADYTEDACGRCAEDAR